MKWLKNIGIGLAALLVILVAIGLVLPSKYEVHRSIDINAHPEKVFAQVNDLKAAEAWSPWLKKDPSIKNTYSANTMGQGAKVSWTSQKMGEGSQVISESTPYSSIALDLDFGSHGVGKALWTFEPLGSGVTVTWSMSGDVGKNIVGRYFNLLMDKMMGPDFEEGLKNLKNLTETPVA